MKKTLLITGANGFLGRGVQSCVPPKWNLLKLLGSRPSRYDEKENNSSVFFDVDKLPVAEELAPSAILHLAAKLPYGGGGRNEMENVNVRLVEKLINKYPNSRHVLASSVSVFDQTASLPISMQSPVFPRTIYSQTKLEAEKIITKCSSFAIIRFSSLVGVGMNGETFLPRILQAAQTGLIDIVGDGTRLQNYLSVYDASEMCLNALCQSENYVMLGVGSKSYTNLQVAQYICAKTGARIRHVNGDQGPSYVYTQDDSLSCQLNRLSLEEIINEMINI